MADIIAASGRIGGAELRERAARARTGFAASGIVPGSRVAILMRNDLAFLEASLALQDLGAYAVPLNWHAVADELAYVIGDCGAAALVVQADLLTPGLRGCIGALPLFVVGGGGPLDWAGWLARQAPCDLPPAPQTESLIYTSGTTGRPKGVMRRAPTPGQVPAVAAMRARMTGIDAAARVLVTAPLYHTAPNMYALRAAREGALLVLHDRFDAEAVLEAIQTHGITHFYAVPTILSRLLGLPEAVRARYDLRSLRFVLHAGSPCAPSLKKAAIDWLGPVIHEYYGSTELGPVTFVTSPEWLARPGTVGRAMPGVLLEIHDEEGRPLGPGEPGEIMAVNRDYPDFTYLNRPEARAELNRGDLLATGDVGWLDDRGYLFICDRKRDLVISGGANIYPAEIEAVLMAMPGVADCAVVGIPDAEFGEALAAFVQPADGAALTEAGIRDFLSGALARFKLPRLIEIRSKLPREESGKIRKRALRDPFWQNETRKI